GMVFTPVPFESEHLLWSSSLEPGTEHGEVTLRRQQGLLASLLQAILSGSLKRVLRPNDVCFEFAYHCCLITVILDNGTRLCLKFIIGKSCTRLYNLLFWPHFLQVKLLPEVDLHRVSWHQHKHILAFISGPNHVTIHDYEDSDRKDPCILVNETQRDVKLLEWRPNGGKTLSIACKGGICIWAASYPGNAASVRSGVTAVTEHFIFGRQTRGRQNHGPQQVALSRVVTLNGIGREDRSGSDTGATWDPDGRMILVSFSDSSTLGSIYFASKPPSLDAHLLPVDLPEIQSLTGSRGIEKIAWDASGERLALSYKDGDDLYKGLVAIYDVRRTPLVSTSLVGFIRGPGENAKPIAFSFHDKLKEGPLLSVCWSSGFCCTYPLIFRSNVLP
ncbi:hypothetical protein RJ639_018852, partial [Escallonia herrerae]